MSKEKKMELLELAKGHVQRSILKDLLNDGETLQFNCYMKSQKHSSNYIRSFYALFARLENNGINVLITKGKLGGHWTAIAKIA